MSKLHLPDVTLVMIETREHTLARMAIEECLDKCEFGDVLIVTDRPLEFSPLTLTHRVYPRFHIVDDFPDKLGWARSAWFDLPLLLRTSHALHIQWDSWVWDTAKWSDDYLAYDYIGAPWWYKDGKNVGNSGFSLVSSRLKRYVYDRRAMFECNVPSEDDLLCRTYRPELEKAGLRWAPERLAHEFSFECARPSPTSRHFGFHAVYNFPEVLSEKALIARLMIAVQSEYIRTGPLTQSLWSKYPSLPKKLAKKMATDQRVVDKVNLAGIIAHAAYQPKTGDKTRAYEVLDR